MASVVETRLATRKPRLGAQIPARIAAWLVLGGAAAYYAVFIGRSAFSIGGRTYFVLFDDSMISMQYARNFAHGHGLVWNAGEHVEGYSNFLWTLWMSLVHLVGVGERYTSLVLMAMAGGLLLATLVVVRRLCELLVPDTPLICVLAMAMTGLFYPLVFWALRGTEVALAALLVALAALLAVQLRADATPRRAWALAATLGLAVLTRDDLIVPCVVVLAWLRWQLPRDARRLTLLIVGGTVVALIAGHEAFRLAYYGDALPNTYYLKLSGLPIKERVTGGIESLVFAVLYSLLAPLLIALFATARRRTSPVVLLLAALVATQFAYSVWVGGDAWEDVLFANRYFSTVAPVLMALTALGVYELGKARPELLKAAAVTFAVCGLLLVGASDIAPHGHLYVTPDGTSQVLPAILLALCAAAVLFRRSVVLALLVLGVSSVVPVKHWIEHNAHDMPVEDYWTRFGVAVHEHTAPGTTVAFVVAGNPRYFSDRTGVDLLGKMDPVVAHGPPTAMAPVRFRPGHNKWNYARSLGDLRPQVIASLWFPTARDLCDVQRWGYRQVGSASYVQGGTPAVDTRGLSEAIERLEGPASPPPSDCP